MSRSTEDETIILANFIEMSGLDFDTASHYLQAANYDISVAFGLMPESGASNDSMPSSQAAPLNPFGNAGFPGEINVRAADPVQQEQLIGRRGVMNHEREMAFARAEDPNVEWIFPPPNHISFPGSLQEVCLGVLILFTVNNML
jgi:hypothetical protein